MSSYIEEQREREARERNAYLDALAAVWIAAPRRSDEEALLERAHEFACKRLGVNPEDHTSDAIIEHVRLTDRLRSMLPDVPDGADAGEILAHVADAIRDRDRLARRVRVLEEREARIVAIAGGRA